MKCLIFQPNDALFFRGSESAEMGADHSVTSIFPPPLSTMYGALRTAILKQNGIDLKDYKKGNVEKSIYEILGPAGEKAGFQLSGPFLMKEKEIFVPAPYSWFAEKSQLESKKDSVIQVKFHRAKSIQSPLIYSDKPVIPWARSNGDELVSLGGNWVRLGDLNSNEEALKIFKPRYFYQTELRTGIALHKNQRTVRQGHLYSFPFIRLEEDVQMIFLISHPLPLEQEGVLYLGGDRRFGFYRMMDDWFSLPEGSSSLYLSINPVEVNETTQKFLFASGKIMYLGGWDLHKKFHKPLRAYFPAGSVFTEKNEQSWIQL